MKSTVRPELSKTNKYWVDKNRFYELKYYCLQYPTWKKLYQELDGIHGRTNDLVYSRLNTPGDPTAKTVEKRSIYFERMEMIEQAAIEADPELASYILKAVTEGLSFNHLKSRLEIPCSRDTYYDRYRRFFWLLNHLKDRYI